MFHHGTVFFSFSICGPFAILTTALSEFHCAKYRTKVLMTMGLIFSCANVALPSISWAILPLPVTTYITETFGMYQKKNAMK